MIITGSAALSILLLTQTHTHTPSPDVPGISSFKQDAWTLAMDTARGEGLLN